MRGGPWTVRQANEEGDQWELSAYHLQKRNAFLSNR